jgi:hypothetical protein
MMSKALDDVVDLIDGAARAVVMYDIHEATEPRNSSPASFNAWPCN